jgi:hypothetical protein
VLVLSATVSWVLSNERTRQDNAQRNRERKQAAWDDWMRKEGLGLYGDGVAIQRQVERAKLTREAERPAQETIIPPPPATPEGDQQEER